MDVLNRAVSAIFDVLLVPLELLGRPTALVLASGVFGILALYAFKYLSFQRGIKAAKNKVKAHLIEIRIYQDDLFIVGKAIISVLGRNAQYFGLNLASFVPLSIPFVFVVAQLVTRYGYESLPLHRSPETMRSGQGTLLSVSLDVTRAAEISGLKLEWPEGLKPISPIVRLPFEGKAYQEFVATRSGSFELKLTLANGELQTKQIVAGTPSRSLQPERTQNFFEAFLWPAEPRLPGSSAFTSVEFVYPDSQLGWLPGGAGGVLIVFLVASMVFGLIVLKPLGIQI
jgi:hypothetical protein